MSKSLEQTLGVLTGAVGDYLARTGNALATAMTLVHAGEPLALTREALAAAYPQASGRVVVLVHGLMATEHGFAYWQDRGDGGTRDFGTILQESRGWTPLRVRYNTGLSTAQSAGELNRLLAQVAELWPVPLTGLTLVCHSMGGLLVREACAQAQAEGQAWLTRLTHVAYLGTPHLGAPLERAGRWATEALGAVPDPVAKLLGQLGDLRSAGIQQLGDPTLLPWVDHAQHLLVASSLAGNTPLRGVVGDGMVSVKSATADDPAHPLPPHVQSRVIRGLHHAQLAFAPAVGELLLEWLPAGQAEAPVVELRQTATGAVPDRLAGLVQLGLDAVSHGHRAVAQVRLGRADQFLAAVKAVAPAAAAPVQALHAAHAGVVTAQHAVLDATMQAGVAVASGMAKVAAKRKAAGSGAVDPSMDT